MTVPMVPERDFCPRLVHRDVIRCKVGKITGFFLAVAVIYSIEEML